MRALIFTRSEIFQKFKRRKRKRNPTISHTQGHYWLLYLRPVDWLSNHWNIRFTHKPKYNNTIQSQTWNSKTSCAIQDTSITSKRCLYLLTIYCNKTYWFHSWTSPSEEIKVLYCDFWPDFEKLSWVCSENAWCHLKELGSAWQIQSSSKLPPRSCNLIIEKKNRRKQNLTITPCLDHN